MNITGMSKQWVAARIKQKGQGSLRLVRSTGQKGHACLGDFRRDIQIFERVCWICLFARIKTIYIKTVHTGNTRVDSV
ncbi:hypothetical protein Gotur_035469 [Gossypium turneri]